MLKIWPQTKVAKGGEKKKKNEARQQEATRAVAAKCKRAAGQRNGHADRKPGIGRREREAGAKGAFQTDTL